MHAPSIVIATATQVERKGYSTIGQPSDWGKHEIPGHVYARWYFPNGYGASIFAGKDFVEVAVLRNSFGNWVIDLDTEITDDVIYVESEGELVDLLTRIKALV